MTEHDSVAILNGFWYCQTPTQEGSLNHLTNFQAMFKQAAQEKKLKVHTNNVHASVNKIIPKKTPKRPIQCYDSTECNSTFDARHKIKKHTREQHDGKFYSPQKENHIELNPKLTKKIAI